MCVLVCVGLMQDEWPLLVVVPASLRLMWAEEFEKWMPHLRPSQVCLQSIMASHGAILANLYCLRSIVPFPTSRMTPISLDLAL